MGIAYAQRGHSDTRITRLCVGTAALYDPHTHIGINTSSHSPVPSLKHVCGRRVRGHSAVLNHISVTAARLV